MDPHFSSGLQNVVFYLMAESGNHPTTGVFVKKIGRERAAAVFFRALVMYLLDFQARPDVQASGLLTGNPAQPYNHHQFIRYCYLTYLQREPDQGGWAFWEAQLNSHGDYNALIRAFLCSAEYRSRFGPA